MPRFRRPQQTVLSGLGMAGAVLAAVVLTFAVASGLIAYNLTSEDPVATTSSAALVLELRADTAASPLVLHARRTAREVRKAAAPAQGARAAADVRGRADGALSASSHTQTSAADAPDGASSVPDQGGARQPAKVPVAKALGDTTQAVGATTVTVGRRLQGVTDGLAAGLSPATQQTGALLEAIGQRTSATLDRLLHKHS